MVNFRRCSANGLSFKEYADIINKKKECSRDIAEAILRFENGGKNLEEIKRLSNALEYNWPDNPVDFWNVEAIRWRGKIDADVRDKVKTLLDNFKGVGIDIGSGCIDLPNTVSVDYAYNSLKLNRNSKKIIADSNRILPFKRSSAEFLSLIFTCKFVDINFLLDEAKRVLKERGSIVIFDSEEDMGWCSMHNLNDYSAEDIQIILSSKGFKVRSNKISIEGRVYFVIIGYI